MINFEYNFSCHVLSSNIECNHYTEIPIINMLQATFTFLDPGRNGKNVVLSNKKGCKRKQNQRQKKVVYTAGIIYVNNCQTETKL